MVAAFFADATEKGRRSGVCWLSDAAGLRFLKAGALHFDETT